MCHHESEPLRSSAPPASSGAGRHQEEDGEAEEASLWAGRRSGHSLRDASAPSPSETRSGPAGDSGGPRGHRVPGGDAGGDDGRAPEEREGDGGGGACWPAAYSGLCVWTGRRQMILRVYVCVCVYLTLTCVCVLHQVLRLIECLSNRLIETLSLHFEFKARLYSPAALWHLWPHMVKDTTLRSLAATHLAFLFNPRIHTPPPEKMAGAAKHKG